MFYTLQSSKLYLEGNKILSFTSGRKVNLKKVFPLGTIRNKRKRKFRSKWGESGKTWGKKWNNKVK